MKKFFATIPLQVGEKLDTYRYEAVGNQLLQMEEKTCFPILTAINGYAQEGEEIRVIAVLTDNDSARKNLVLFETAVRELCQRKHLTLHRGVEAVQIPEDERVAVHTATFQRLIDFAEDNDELFVCMTYGTKPLCTVLLMAAQYAYRIKRNASIGCVVYGQVVRPQPDRSTWRGKVYDMTALVQIDEAVRILADRGVADPKKVLDRMLSL